MTALNHFKWRIFEKMLRFTSTSFAILFACLAAQAQPFNWLWAHNATGAGTGEGYSVAADPHGNVYVTGSFGNEQTMNFGSTVLTNANSSGNYYDFFLAKYDSSGNLLWARSAGGTYDEESICVCSDAAGNAIVCGYFQSPSITIGTTTLVPNGGEYVFIAKYDPSGNVLWAKTASGASTNSGQAVCSVGASGAIYLTGFYRPSVSFGTYTLTNNTPGYNIFIVKYDQGGNVLWAKSVDGVSGDNESTAISEDTAGNVFLAGYFYSTTLSFGNATLTNSDPSGNTPNFFVAKFDASGNDLWAQSAPGGAKANAVSAGPSGEVFVAGSFGETSFTIGSFVLQAPPNRSNAFTAKYDTGGNVLWAKAPVIPANALNVSAYSVSADLNGNVYESGSFYNPDIIFGADTLYCSACIDPMYVVKMDGNGNVLCAEGFDSGGDDRNSICADPFGSAFLGGDLEAVSSPFSFGANTLSLTGYEDVFATRFRCGNMITGSYSPGASENAWIYPNPSDGVFHISLREPILDITVTDLPGKTVFVTTDAGSLLDLSFLPPGFYIVHVRTAAVEKRWKIVKR